MSRKAESGRASAIWRPACTQARDLGDLNQKRGQLADGHYLVAVHAIDHLHDIISAPFNDCMEDIVHAWLLRVRDLEVRAAPCVAAADACCAAWLKAGACVQALLQARRSELEVQDASVKQLQFELKRSRRQQARLGLALATKHINVLYRLLFCRTWSGSSFWS